MLFRGTWTDRLEKWLDGNLMELNKRECKVLLHLGMGNCRHQYMLGAKCLGGSFVEDDLGVLLDTKLNVSQQCASLEEDGHQRPGCCMKRSVVSRSRQSDHHL